MEFTHKEMEMVLMGLRYKRAQLAKDLEETDSLIKKAESVVINNSVNNEQENEFGPAKSVIRVVTVKRRKRSTGSKDFYFDRIKKVLFEADNVMSSREILNEIYKEFPDEIDMKDDRRHIAAVSSALYFNVPEEVELIDSEKGHAKFKLVKDKKHKMQEIERQFGL